MKKKIAIVMLMMIIEVSFPMRTMQGIPIAQKASVPKPQDNLAIAEDEVKQLLLLIDTSNTGKVTKHDWMKFMEAEFDRLDKKKSGEIDAKELAQSRLRVSAFAKMGK